jgi:hypothetical protein
MLRKSVKLHLDAPHLHLPDKVSLVTNHEVSRIKVAMPSEAKDLIVSKHD